MPTTVPRRAGERPRARETSLACAGVATVVTGVVALLPSALQAYRSLPLKVSVETAIGLVGLLVAYLALGRYRRHRRARDLLLTQALALLALSNLALAALPTALTATAGASLTTWAPLLGRLGGGVLLCAAALTGPDRRLDPAQASRRTAALVLAGLVAAVGLGLAEAVLPSTVDAGLPETPPRTLVVGHPVVLGAQLLGVLLYGVSAVAFTRQADAEGDQLLRWLGAACAVSAVARLNYFLLPSLYSDWVYTGDALRLAGYVLLLVGAQREIAAYFAQERELGRADERRRVARDLHDGLVQELAFIRGQSARLARGRVPAEEAADIARRVARASERATDEARAAIAALTRTGPVDLADAVAEAAELVAERHGGEVGLELDRTVTASQEEQEALVRVAAEAVGNALRHGGVPEVVVRLASSPQRVLQVCDTGAGFDPTLARAREGHHFGLVSMRERVERVGGRLRVESAPGQGTTVEVTLP